MIKLIKKILKILKNRKVNKIIKFIIENNDMINDRLDEILAEVEKRKNTKDVQMSLDYVPSWITGAKTLLEKINKCVEKIETLSSVTLYRHTITDTYDNTFIVKSYISEPFSNFNDVFANSIGYVRDNYGIFLFPLDFERIGYYRYDIETGDVEVTFNDMPVIATDVIETV